MNPGRWVTSDYCHSSLNDSQMVINALLEHFGHHCRNCWWSGGPQHKHLLQALRKIGCNEEDELISFDKVGHLPFGSWSLRRFLFVDRIIHLSKAIPRHCDCNFVLCALCIVHCANVQMCKVQLCKCASFKI